MNEEILRRAAGAAVASGDADAVILFGSRALGTAGPSSDWDVCIVGGRGEREAVDAIVGHDSLVDEEALDIVWVPSAKSFADVPAATVWADIVRCGQVIGGDRGMLRNIEIKPFSVERLAGQLGMAVEMIEAAVEAGERFRMSDGADWQQRRALRATLDSAHAAEALTIVFCALADTRYLAGHVQGKVADLIRERAGELDDRVDRATVSRMAECAEEMNGNVKVAHGAPYRLVPESESQWCKRLLWAMRSHGELVEGVVWGTGPMAALAAHERAGELKVVMRRSAGDAERAVEDLFDRLGTRFHHSLNEGVKVWHRQCRDVLRRVGDRGLRPS